MQTKNDRLIALWLAEAIKRKEQAGTIDDSLVIAQLANESASDDMTDEALICRRALLLTQHNPVVESLPKHIVRMYTFGKTALVILAITAVVAGLSLASSVLLQGFRLNVFLLLLVLLMPHLLGLLWAIVLYGRLDSSSSWIADAWVWLTKRIARRQDAALLIESLGSLLGHGGNLPLMLLGISHLWWVLFAFSTMVMMYLVFSFAQYTFTWGTTIQQPEFFLMAIKSVGWLPGLIGFSLPDSTDIASLADNAETRKTWAVFILGCLAIYALVPRLLMLAFSWAAVRKSLRSVSIAFADAYYINVLNRIRSALRKPPEITDAAPTHIDATGVPVTPVPRNTPLQKVTGIVPFELRETPTLAQFQANLHCETFDNVVDDLTQQAVLNGILERNIGNVVLLYDARNTADRGAFQFLRHLKSTCDGLQVVLLNQEAASPHKLVNWIEGLKEIGIETILNDVPTIRSSSPNAS